MWADAMQFRNSSGLFTSRELSKKPSKADTHTMVKDTQAGKRKLNNAGTLILKEHLRLHPEDTHPTSYTLNTLLEQVRNAQNNQDISYHSISTWFQRRRLKLQKEAPQSTTSSTTPTMPFSPDNLRKLQTLIESTPDPTSDVLDVWASFFHVSKAMLHHAIHVILPETASQDANRSQAEAEQSAFHRSNAGTPFQRLPTPANSLTPEPATTPAANVGGSPEFMKNECNTPTLTCSNATLSERGMVAQSQQIRHHTITESIPAPVLNQVAHAQLSPPPTPINLPAQVNSQASETGKISTTVALFSIPLTRHILSGITEACSDAPQNGHDDVLPPKTAAEFQALFAPYKKKFETLSRILDVSFENAPADKSSNSRKSI